MRVLSLFSGIGAFEKALYNQNISFELVNYCEIDKYASKAYSLIHKVTEDKNINDVKKVNTKILNDIDLITYGFPCQDLSNSGKQKGFIDDKGNTTRSGLFFEALRIIGDTRPKIAIAENVKALTSKKFEQEFNIVLGSLSRLGYNNYYKVLNAKDYGIPQNRERVFIISIRQDIDNGFVFPKREELKTRLKDILYSSINDKYFIPFESLKSLKYDENPIKTDKVLQVGRISKSQDGVVVDARGISPTHTAGHGNCPKILFYCNNNMQIRKLTPLECFRLMGFADNDYQVLKDSNISDSQIYKMAGNSIVVNVLSHIFNAFAFQYPDIFKVDFQDTNNKNQITIDDII